MINFDLDLKTKLYFGRQKEEMIGDILKAGSYQKVMIVIGQNSVKKSGLLDRVLNKIKEANIDYCLLEGVRANPEINLCRKGVKMARDYQPDIILAIGGGSVMDTAKSIAVGYYYEGDTFDFNLHLAKPIKALPVGVIVTIAASGSEGSNSCVIQDDLIHKKAGFNSDLIRPVFAIENPELTYTVSKEQTIYGIVDILMHTLERYFQPSEGVELADSFAEGLIKTVIHYAYQVINNLEDYEGRAALLLCSTLSHNGITGIGKPFFMPVHQLEHALSGVYKDVAHGAGLSILFPRWAKYYALYDEHKFARFARHVFDVKIDNDLEAAYEGINRLIMFFKDIGAPLSYKDVGLEDVDIDKLVNVLTNNKTKIIPHHIKDMDHIVIKEIYQSCK